MKIPVLQCRPLPYSFASALRLLHQPVLQQILHLIVGKAYNMIGRSGI